MTLLARLLAILAALAPLPAAAQSFVVIEEWVEVVDAPGAARFVSQQQAQVERAAIAAYGPFRVVDAGTAALVGTTDSRSPRQFAALLRDYPQVAVLEFVEVPGTADDLANMALGRMIRTAGLTTRVPPGGSVRSGGVELFVAGARMEIAEGSEFAVHGWLDEHGRGAEDYAPGAPEHRRYLDYYREMGMAGEQAAAFYAMTNSVPFEDARWLTGAEMAGWLGLDAAPRALPLPPQPEPRLAYLDLGPLLP
jgi:hypothetical protein